ncbi:MAG: SAM-dependent methyltransferase [Clostridia bacterium]|nr:SAM-dependent methyltransferase [Clostridia bacterium]
MNKLTLRLNTILGELAKCNTFADVGCDHGYVAEAMLSEGKCDFVYVTDVSGVCLKKAEDLLKNNYDGKFKAIVTDGLKNVPKVEQVLIAGMGGELICDILKNADFLPERLVLQPMKNTEKVRKTVISLGYKMVKDTTFKDVKYYDLIVCEKGEESYSEYEIEFGRDNLRDKGDAFKEVILKKLAVIDVATKTASEEERKRLENLKKKYEEVIS